MVLRLFCGNMRPPEEYESPAQVIDDIIEDPETKAVQFVSVGDDGGIVSWGMSDGSEQSSVELAAAGLLHQAGESEQNEEEFIKKVIHEYNGQKKSEQAMEL
jgi:hypothetical protein